MDLDRPVKIPEVPGKITFDRKNDAVYVRYLISNRYDRERKYAIPQRKEIGVRIENMPTMMMPNENYIKYFTREGKEMKDAEGTGEILTETEEEYSERRVLYKRYRAFFEELFYEIKAQSRGRLEAVVPEYQVAAVNRVLRPLKEMMEGEEYSEMLEMIEESGMSYGDAVVLLCNYKTALSRYYSERL